MIHLIFIKQTFINFCHFVGHVVLCYNICFHIKEKVKNEVYKSENELQKTPISVETRETVPKQLQKTRKKSR